MLDRHLAERRGAVVDDLDQVVAADGWARAQARERLGLKAPEVSDAIESGAAA